MKPEQDRWNVQRHGQSSMRYRQSWLGSEQVPWIKQLLKPFGMIIQKPFKIENTTSGAADKRHDLIARTG